MKEKQKLLLDYFLSNISIRDLNRRTGDTMDLKMLVKADKEYQYLIGRLNEFKMTIPEFKVQSDLIIERYSGKIFNK